MNLFCIFVLLLLHLTHASRLNTLKTVNDYMNICLLGNNQKTAPGPEPDLLLQICSPWANRSCCTTETAEGIRINPKWLNFDWDHCGTLSDRCREHFIMDLCFYECSPNVGPWLVVDERKIRKERFREVPLCKRTCDNWWNACEYDSTCLDNWAQGFNWSTGINTCPTGSSCRLFRDVFLEANTFCEKVMGNSFKVVPDTSDCFVMWFNPTYPNPNEAVAKKKALSLLGIPSTGSHSETSVSLFTVFWVLYVLMTSTKY